MKVLKYTIIKTSKQYNDYCNMLEELLIKDKHEALDEIELLTLIIEKWDTEHNTFNELNPVEIIKALLEENNLKPKDLVEILNLSKDPRNGLMKFLHTLMELLLQTWITMGISIML